VQGSGYAATNVRKNDEKNDKFWIESVMACLNAVSLNLPGEAEATRQILVRVSGFNKNFVAMVNLKIRLHSKSQIAVKCQTILLLDLQLNWYA
jgi:hypothetical protein